jgi:NAD-dependent deacetylase
MSATLPDPLAGQLDAVARRAAQAGSIAVLTGAGVSAESGIPTFRDAQTGLWAKYDPVMLASLEGFMEAPADVWRWYDERRQSMRQCQPNPGHAALAQWEQRWRELGRGFRVITQNIDNLHTEAGSRDTVELHGNIWYARPLHGALRDVQPLLECPLREVPPYDKQGRLLRPHVVWFGELLDPAVLEEGIRLAEQCDLMLVVGTSSAVYPAAALPYAVLRRHKPVAEINPSPTEFTHEATHSLRGPGGVILPLLWERVQALLQAEAPG